MKQIHFTGRSVVTLTIIALFAITLWAEKNLVIPDSDGSTVIDETVTIIIHAPDEYPVSNNDDFAIIQNHNNEIGFQDSTTDCITQQIDDQYLRNDTYSGYHSEEEF